MIRLPRLPLLERLRTRAFRFNRWFTRVLAVRLWFPHVPLAVLIGLGGFWLLRVEFGASWRGYLNQILRGSLHMPPYLLPPVLIGGGLVVISFGLLWRSRIAWNMAFLLLVTGTISKLFFNVSNNYIPEYYLAILIALTFYWKRFDRASIAASTLFALTSVAMAITYAAFGSYYLGQQFKPPIADLITALYFSMVTMSTVGYGDITPQTPEAQLFVVSLIVLGIATFATSLTAVIAPLVTSSLQRIVKRGGIRMKRENHFVVIGNTPLAINVWRQLTERGRPVTRILPHALPEGVGPEADTVVGDPSSVEVLREAGAARAEAVLAMLDDDGDNAFVILALREIGGSARSIAAINDAAHEQRIRLVQPDMTIAPQILGGELLAMMLSGEPVTSDFVMNRVLHTHTPLPAAKVITDTGKAD